jgi:hypothetical protein
LDRHGQPATLLLAQRQHKTWSRDEGMAKITLTALLPAANGDLWMGGFATGGAAPA